MNDIETVPEGVGLRSVRHFMAMVPPETTHNDLEVHRRGGRAFVGKSDALRGAEDALAARMGPLVEQVAGVPLAGPLRLRLTWSYAETCRHVAGDPKTSRPDLSNMAKTLEDVLVRQGVIADDALIVEEVLVKGYGAVAGVGVEAEEIGW